MRTSFLSLAAVLVCVSPYAVVRLPAEERSGPVWLTEVSAISRVGYDSNVFGVDNARADAPLANRKSWTGSLGVKAVVSLAAMLKAPRNELQIGYAPTANRFQRASGEDHTLHRIIVTSEGRRGDWSWSVDNTATWIDGPDDSPRFKACNIFGMGMVRDRRAQLLETGKAWLRYDAGGWFARSVANAQFCDYRTELRAPSEADAGRLNWVDRSDANGGLDLGWKISPATSLLLGGRLGRQRQATTPWMPRSSSNDYARVLLGFEGRPTKWLSGSLLAGPDFRHYAAATQYMTDRTPVARHYAGSLTATLGPADSVTLTARQERWLSSTGQSAYDATGISLAWQHGFSAAWSLQVGGQFQQGRYPAPLVRQDVLLGGLAQLRWRVAREVAVTLDATVQSGGDRLGLPATAGRSYHRAAIGLGVHYAR